MRANRLAAAEVAQVISGAAAHLVPVAVGVDGGGGGSTCARGPARALFHYGCRGA